MDMKKILQAMDGVATKPVVGSASMAQFLRVVKEAELNQKTAPVTKPVPSKPVTAPSGNLTSTEMVAILSGQKTQAQVMADREAKKADPGVKEGLVDGSGNPVSSGSGQPVQTAQAAAPAAPAVASTLSPEQLEYNRLRAQLDSLDALRDTGGRQNVFVSRDPALDAKEAQFRDALAKMAASLKAKGIDAAAEYEAPEPGEPEAAPVDLAKKYATEEAAPVTQPDPKYVEYAQLMAKYDMLAKEMQPDNSGVEKGASPDAIASINAIKAKAAQLAGPNLQAWEQARQKENAGSMAQAQANVPALTAQLENVGMSRLLSIMNEGKSPRKVALPVQMAMQHYQTPVKQAINETNSVFKTYVALVEDDISEKKIAKQQLIRQYSQRIAEAVLMKERVVGGEETPPGINRLTGKPNPPEAAPADTPAVVPLGKRFDPRFKNGPEPYTIDIDGVVYKFAGRTATGPGTGEVIKVPAAVIGIRGLSAVSVELGKDGMYYPAPATNESKNIKR